jgi:hypothetical protein
MNDAEQQEAGDHRQLLLDMLEYQAGWRYEKAIQHPDDERNENSANALRQLAEHLTKLSPSDGLWLLYGGAWDRLSGAALERANEEERDALRIYGFSEDTSDVSPEDAAKFLRNRVQSLEGYLAEKD